MFNKLFAFVQTKAEYLYENSFILQKIDNLILLSILSVFVASVFASSDVLGGIAFLSLFLTLIKLLCKKGERLECNKFEVALICYLMFVVISLFASSLFTLSLKGFEKTVIYLGFYLSLVQYLKNNKDKIWWIIITIAACLSYETIVALWQSILRPDEISTWQDTTNLNPEEILSRVYGTLQPLNPNLLGGYFVATIPMVLATTLKTFIDKNKKLFVPSLVFLILSCIALFLTGCRGAYIALFAIFICVSLIVAKYLWAKYKKQFLTVIFSIAGVGILALFSVEALRARIFSIFAMRDDSSNSFRFNVYQSSFDMFKDNWLFGIGVGNKNFREIYGLYMKTGFDALSSYNIFLEIAVESGIFALFAFVAFIGLVLYSVVKKILENDFKNIIIVACAGISIFALMVHGLVDTVFFRPQIQFVFWTMVALVRADEYEN